LNKLLAIITLGIMYQGIAQSPQPSVCYNESVLIERVPLLQKNKDQIKKHQQSAENELRLIAEDLEQKLGLPHDKKSTIEEEQERNEKFQILFQKFSHQLDSIQKDYFSFEKLQLLKIDNLIQTELSAYTAGQLVSRPVRKIYLECHENCNDITDQLILYFTRGN